MDRAPRFPSPRASSRSPRIPPRKPDAPYDPPGPGRVARFPRVIDLLRNVSRRGLLRAGSGGPENYFPAVRQPRSGPHVWWGEGGFPRRGHGPGPPLTDPFPSLRESFRMQLHRSRLARRPLRTWVLGSSAGLVLILGGGIAAHATGGDDGAKPRPSRTEAPAKPEPATSTAKPKPSATPTRTAEPRPSASPTRPAPSATPTRTAEPRPSASPTRPVPSATPTPKPAEPKPSASPTRSNGR